MGTIDHLIRFFMWLIFLAGVSTGLLIFVSIGYIKWKFRLWRE